MDLSIPYYKDTTRTSNSDIGAFLKCGARYYRDMKDGNVEKNTATYLEKGTMIHMYILEPEKFWDEYQLLEFQTPNNKYQVAFAEAYINSNEIMPHKRLIEAYTASYSTKNKTENKILADAEALRDQLADYINYLQTSKATHKKIISWADVDMLKQIKENLSKHKLANNLLFNLPESREQHNEFQINWEFPKEYHNITLPCKSLIDRLLIDHTKKHITLIDVKTTVDVYNFRESVEKYDYLRQLSYYWLAIHWYFKNELNIDISEYTYSTYIIAIQSTGSYTVKVFEFKPEDLEGRLDTISKAISEICWHTQNNEWDYDYRYYNGSGAEMY